MRTASTSLIVMLSAFGGFSLVGPLVSFPPQNPCNIKLRPQKAVAECVTGMIHCGGTGQECCYHAHGERTWSICEADEEETGKICNPTPTKVYYPLTESSCNGTNCLHQLPTTCTTHYENDFSLLPCPQ